MFSSLSSPVARRILALALPVMIGQWAVITYGVLDTVMTGHSSALDLAALALGSAVYISIYVSLMGVIFGLGPIVAQHFGAQRMAQIGSSFIQSVWLSLGLALAGALVMLSPDPWLIFSDPSPELRQAVGGYLHGLAFALPAALVFRAVYALNAAIARPRAVMIINLFGLALKLVCNYTFIFGHFGAPALGAAGCGLATAIVMWVTCALGLLVLRYDPFYHQFQFRYAGPNWAQLLEILRIGVPTGLSYLVEVTSFTFMALLVARLGPAVTGAHQITMNLAVIGYAIPMGLAVAVATLAGQSLGAGHAREALHVVKLGFRLAFVLAGVVVLALGLLRNEIAQLYSNDPAVVLAAPPLILLLVPLHLADALQTVAGYALRAYKHAVAPMLIYTLSLWGIGLGGGYVLAFVGAFGIAPMGAAGLWAASAVSLFVASGLLYTYLMALARRLARGEARPLESALGST